MITDALTRMAAKPERVVAGFMCGTSLDGIDIALTRIRGSGSQSEVQLLGYASEPYQPELRARFLNLQMPSLYNSAEQAELSFGVAELYAEALIRLADRLGVKLSEIDLVGHHGVIMYHGRGFHVDLCEASVIAERTGLTVITDFRLRDCAAGGQGAPLSPYVDWILFKSPTLTRAIQNIGGIANVCAVPAGGGIDSLIGFDTGPGNMVMDGVVSVISDGQLAYDAAGKLASSGRVNGAMLDDLMSHPYIQRGLPKCAGREEFGVFFAKELVAQGRATGMKDNDIVATATAFTAEAIAEGYRRFIYPKHRLDEVVVGGGGVHNEFLMGMLREMLAPVPVRTHEDFGIASDAREALSWAVLANETLVGNPANVPQVTGAKRRVVLGKIIPA